MGFRISVASVARSAGSSHFWHRVPRAYARAYHSSALHGSLKADTQSVVAEAEALSDHRALADPVSQPAREREPRVSAGNHQAQRLRSDDEQAREQSRAMDAFEGYEIVDDASDDEEISEAKECRWARLHDCERQARDRRRQN